MKNNVESFTGIKEIAQWLSKAEPGLAGVVVLTLNKEGGCALKTSLLNHAEKSFLGQFYNAWLANWFIEKHNAGEQ